MCPSEPRNGNYKLGADRVSKHTTQQSASASIGTDLCRCTVPEEFLALQQRTASDVPNGDMVMRNHSKKLNYAERDFLEGKNKPNIFPKDFHENF